MRWYPTEKPEKLLCFDTCESIGKASFAMLRVVNQLLHIKNIIENQKKQLGICTEKKSKLCKICTKKNQSKNVQKTSKIKAYANILSMYFNQKYPGSASISKPEHLFFLFFSVSKETLPLRTSPQNASPSRDTLWFHGHTAPKAFDTSLFRRCMSL